MASNNNTEVVNGVVQPRFYQVYGDLIESKEIMEPLSINAGTGPICGFDWVDTSKTSVTITSIFKSNSGAKGLSMLKGKSRRVFLSDKNNNAGRVFNAYTTPDGLCHIAPDTLTFNGMQPEGGWPSTTNPTKLVSFIVKASHTYRPNNSENPPSLANFTCNWLTLDSKTYLSTILKWNYEEVLQAISKSGISFDPNTETIIGIYLVGWNTSWNEDTESVRLKALISDFNYILCLVPIHGQFPVKPYGMNPLDILDLKARVKVLEESTVSGDVNYLMSHVNNLISSLGQGVEVVVSKDSSSSDDNEGFIFTKLNINGSNFVAAGPVTKTLDYQWYEASDAMGIFVSPEIDIDSKTQQVPTDKWDIGTVSFKPNSEGAMGYSFAPPIGKETWKLVGCILPQFSDYSNNSICVPTGFYQLMNPDAAIGWRVAMNLKRLHSRLGILEVADSGKVPFKTTSSTDHYAYIRALMGTSTLTLRVVVSLYNKGTSNAGLTYDLSELFSKNPKMSLMLSAILKLSNRFESITRVMMAMPSTFKARDIAPDLPSSEDCEFSKYTSWLEITHTVARIRASVGTVTKASGQETWVEVDHMITIPISDRTGEEYAGIQTED